MTAELQIKGSFPRTACFVQVDLAAFLLITMYVLTAFYLRLTSCFVQVDLAAFCIRWSQRDSISLHLVVEVADAPLQAEEIAFSWAPKSMREVLGRRPSLLDDAPESLGDSSLPRSLRGSRHWLI